MAGRVVVINGASSAGKTSLGRALQARLPEPWLLFGIDTFLGACPPMHAGPDGLMIHPDGVVTRGARFRDDYDGWRHAVAELVRHGNNVILDEVFLDGYDDQQLWETALAGIAVLWVGLRCAPDIAAQRETDRGDRHVGLARHQTATVHAGVRYDFEIDSSEVDTNALAERLLVRMIGVR